MSEVGIVYSAAPVKIRVWRNEGEDKLRIEAGGFTLFLDDASALEIAEQLRVGVLTNPHKVEAVAS